MCGYIALLVSFSMLLVRSERPTHGMIAGDVLGTTTTADTQIRQCQSLRDLVA